MKQILASLIALSGSIEAGHGCQKYYNQNGFNLGQYYYSLWRRGFQSSYTSDSTETSVINAIMTHGCWCSRFDDGNPFREFTGGPDPIDDLDEICKRWFFAHNANKRLNGGFCKNEEWKSGAYQYTWTIDSCKNNDDWVCTSAQNNDCQGSTCRIDLFYMKLMRQWLRDNDYTSSQQLRENQFFMVTDNTTCSKPVPDHPNLRRKSANIPFRNGQEDIVDSEPFFRIGHHLQESIFNNITTGTYGSYSTYGFSTHHGVDANELYSSGWWVQTEGHIISEDENQNKIKIQLANEYTIKFQIRSEDGPYPKANSYVSRDDRTILYIGDEGEFITHRMMDIGGVAGLPRIVLAANTANTLRFNLGAATHNNSLNVFGKSTYPENNLDVEGVNLDLPSFSDGEWHDIEFKTFLVLDNENINHSEYFMEIYYDDDLQFSKKIQSGLANADGSQYRYVYTYPAGEVAARIQIRNFTYQHETQTPEIKWWNATRSFNLQTVSELEAEGWTLCPGGNIAGKVMTKMDRWNYASMDKESVFRGLTWHEAKEACEASGIGASLFSILNSSENDCLKNIIDAKTAEIQILDSASHSVDFNMNEPWIGLNDLAEQFTWVWTTATGNDIPAAYFNWHTNEPDNNINYSNLITGDQRCGDMYAYYKTWHDQQCHQTRNAWACGVRDFA